LLTVHTQRNITRNHNIIQRYHTEPLHNPEVSHRTIT
jgi:hypothetical protein